MQLHSTNSILEQTILRVLEDYQLVSITQGLEGERNEVVEGEIVGITTIQARTILSEHLTIERYIPYCPP